LLVKGFGVWCFGCADNGGPLNAGYVCAET
jgi:hypothetical protein